ncbi:MAG: DUF3320 domain-containing protein, partial [Muribaculaceae bacterium]|nr:DUF3320 domain-containing protein [Muribaculaceae bacterium]
MAIKVSVSYVPVINFSMQQNHVPVIREIILKNDGEEELTDLSISLESDPAFAEPTTLHVDAIVSGSEVRLTTVPVRISATYLSNLTERVEGHIKVTVKSNDEILFSESYEIAVLAFDQWGGIAVLPEMLAAFVTPNQPEIMAIVKRASEILGSWTDSSAMDEYQTRDPNRVKKQMAAIYEAIAERKIAYCSVPASFEEYGQRIRLYGDILSNKLGNCLDMTLLYAGCLEAVGIHPLIVLTRGHAFAGGWLIPDSFPDSVNDDVSLLTKRTADGINEILLVETTCMNEGKSISFDTAVDAANDKLNNPDDFILFIDVLRARNAQIRPLPRRVVRDGVYEIEEESIQDRPNEAPKALSATDILTNVDRVDVGKQTIWERKLLDLSLRNSLLNTRITKNTLQLISVKINELEDALADGEEFQIFAKPNDWDNPLLSAGIYQSINAKDPIIDLVEGEFKQKRLRSYLDEEALQRSLTHLYRTSRLSLEENGANTLYLALGLLKWFETPSSTRPRFAPILLLPIEIIRKSAAKGYVIRTRDEETMLNITLQEMLRQYFGISIKIDPLPRDEKGIDVPKVLNIIRRAIMSQTGWDVEEQAIIGNFSFSKFIMWNDIHNNADKLARNKVVASLISGKLEWQPESCSMENIDLDEEFPAGAVALPISADSSQFEAICAAVDNKSFILHGPPGTGKSQTITNIIANALYNGKKVLFVAEKMAALQVVQRRLESIGLAPFCLEMHSNKTKKSSVLEQLKRTTEVVKRKSSEKFRAEAEQINALRRELNDYVHTLHKIYPAGLSLYDCFAGYASSGYDGKTANVAQTTLAETTPASKTEADIAVSEYQTICNHCGLPGEHPLAGIGLTAYSSSAKGDAKQHLENLSRNLKQLLDTLPSLSAVLKFDPSALSSGQIQSLKEIATVLMTADAIPVELLKTAHQQELFSRIDEAVKTGLERDEICAKLLSDFDRQILTCDTAAWENQWNASLSKWWLPRFLSQRKIRSRLKALSKTKRRLTNDEISRLFPSLDRYHEDKTKITDFTRQLGSYFGLMWSNENPDWNAVTEASKNVSTLYRNIGPLTRDIAKTTEFRKNLCDSLECGPGAFRDMYGDKLRSFLDVIAAVSAESHYICDLLATQTLADHSEYSVDEQLAIVNRWLENLDLLHDRVTYNAMRRKLEDLGFGGIVSMVEDGKVPVALITGFYKNSFYKSYAEYILDREPMMNEFHGMLFEEKVERFKSLISEFERLTRDELYAKLAAGLPALQKEAAQSSEVGILQRNIRNGGRGTSIRKLFDQIPDLLTRMCPCMLMSPISVAQYIDAGGAPFDLVIFDEASQMPTSEAVGAIARGANVIVVGDPKQMPPTSFFSTNAYDEDNADKEDLESILDDCLALTLPSKYLLWHYRSKHESLIAFSNVKFYENKLLTFPSPDDLTTKVGWQQVKGVYDRGKTRQNRAEAEAIIAEVKKRLSNPETARRSIGIVTFNTNQQSLIEDLLTDMFRDNPELETIALEREEPIFIKNLENVQGDERDVILFSIGYGPDKDGKIALNFGPLNRDGGWRRLNVAVSRARYEMKVFSTLTADQIDLNRTSADGVAGLKAFLEYAEKGRGALYAQIKSDTQTTDDLILSIAADLTARGYTVKTNVGCSGYKIDLGVVDPDNPDKYLLGILCDGYNYKTARTAHDRIVTQSSVLKMLGWNLHRVWSMDWWDNRDRTIDAIVKAIQDAKEGKATPAEPAATETKLQPEPEPQPEPVIETVSKARPYSQAQLSMETVAPDEFISGRHDRKAIGKIHKVIEAEAPISKNLLCKRVLNSFGITRMGARLSAYMDYLLAQSNVNTTGLKTVFYWSKDENPDTYDIYRPDSGRDAL